MTNHTDTGGESSSPPSDTMETAISNLTARSIASSPISTFAATYVRQELRFKDTF